MLLPAVLMKNNPSLVYAFVEMTYMSPQFTHAKLVYILDRTFGWLHSPLSCTAMNLDCSELDL